MITLKVPFKKGWRYKEKELDFAFNIGALEYATNKLGIELWEIFEFAKKSNESAYNLDACIMHGAYLMGCVKNKKRPKYNIAHAIMWSEYMSKTEKAKMAEELKTVFGNIGKSAEETKKKTKK